MKHIAAAAFMLAFCTSLDAETRNASTGLPFLKLGIGGRAIAMGEAYSALSHDVSGIFYNPAGLTFEAGDELTLMHKQWIFGTNTEFLGSAVHTGNFVLGFGINSTNVDGIEIRRQPGPSEGTFGLHDFAASATASWLADSTLSIGLTAKFLYEKIYIDESNGTAFDAGVQYQPIRDVTLAFAVSNIGVMSKLASNETKLPSAARLGAAYFASVNQDFRVTVSSDAVTMLSDEGTRVHLGAEITYNSVVALRGGYQFGYEAKGVSAGFGICRGILRFDYAYVPFADQLGDAHTFALTFSL